MKNITLTIDDETHRRARICAAERGTSISALVKDYLNALVDAQSSPPPEQGVRELPMPYTAMPLQYAPPSAVEADLAPNGPPWLVDGKWVYTRDGKPRQPGAMRCMGGWTEDFDTWPDGFLDAMHGEDSYTADAWWKPFAVPPSKS